MKKTLLVSTALFLTSCSSLPDWLGSDDDVVLPGKRYAVMEDAVKPAADASLDEAVEVPAVSDDSEFGMHAGNYGANGPLTAETSADAGSAADDDLFLTSQPVIAEGKVFIIDGESKVIALDAKTLGQIWSNDLTPPEEDANLPGGGIAYAYGVLYASTGYGHLVAISSNNGSELWRKDLGMALRRPPVVVDDKLYVVTADNQLFSLSVVDGSTIWRHTGARETTAVYGSSTPAVKNDVAVIAYSSGEIFGINTIRGNEMWSELISLGSSRKSAASSINDVTASPVIADGIAYVGGHSGDIAAFNLTNGFRIWQQRIGAVDSTPWVAGKWIFAIGGGNNLVALNRYDGRIKWVSTLPERADKDEPHISWSGPVMAGGRLLIVGSNGLLIQADAASGKILSKTEISNGIFEAPVMFGGKAYMLSSEGKLVVIQ